MAKEYRSELAKNLLKLNDEEFNLSKKIFIDSKVKFYKGPISPITTLNTNIIKELNTEQLKFLHDLIHEELEKREG